MVKHTQTIRRLLPMNCLSVFDYFVGLALKGLKTLQKLIRKNLCIGIFFIKVAKPACNFVNKETLAQVFLCEFCKSFKSTYLIKHFTNCYS